MNHIEQNPRRPLIRIAAALALLFIELSWGGDSVSTNIPAGVTPLQSSTLHNLFAVATNLYSGSSPDSEEAFAALASLGVKTIISVDGAKPNVAMARKHGLRYVHLPHGYDGISTTLQLQLAKAAEALPGPIYVHCHHGKHRGPASAAVICMAQGGWTCDQAEAWLVTAGTATNYPGLYEVVRQFRKPTAAQLAALFPRLPETAKVSGLVDAMVGLDKSWNHLKAIRDAAYQTPKEHPDINPASEAVILWEHYREAQRIPNAGQHGADFVKRLLTAEQEAREAEQLLRSFATDPKTETRLHLDRSFDAMGTSCTSCHKAYRDTRQR